MTEPRDAQTGKTGVAVVGGGIAGLTAASYLARAGTNVTVFEKAPEPGGRAATLESAGFLFNCGGHALYTGGAASSVLAELGVTYGHGTPKGTFVLILGGIYAQPDGRLREAKRADRDRLHGRDQAVPLRDRLPDVDATDRAGVCRRQIAGTRRRGQQRYDTRRCGSIPGCCRNSASRVAATKRIRHADSNPDV